MKRSNDILIYKRIFINRGTIHIFYHSDQTMNNNEYKAQEPLLLTFELMNDFVVFENIFNYIAIVVPVKPNTLQLSAKV